MNIPPELIEVYKNTRFTVFVPSIEFKIEEVNQSIENLLNDNNSDTWAYITAFNPNSEIIPDKENNQRFQQLIKYLDEYKTYIGEGIGEDPAWVPEKSILVLGISLEEASRIGKYFGQNDIVFGKKGREAQLILLN